MPARVTRLASGSTSWRTVPLLSRSIPEQATAVAEASLVAKRLSSWSSLRIAICACLATSLMIGRRSVSDEAAHVQELGATAVRAGQQVVRLVHDQHPHLDGTQQNQRVAFQAFAE